MPRKTARQTSRTSVRQTKQTKQHAADCDVLVVGGGLAGLSFALLLSRAGIRTTVIDRQDLTTQTSRAYDVRTTAIAAGSARVLTAANVWHHVADVSCPITHIEILDGARNGDWPVLLNFPSDVVGNQPFGWIVDNQDLRIALGHEVTRAQNLTLIAPASVQTIDVGDDYVTVTLNDGQQISTTLLVGADGRASQVRDHYRIRTRGWPYDHTAIVCTIRHTGAHGNIAIEHFRSDGPFAALPMTDDTDGTPRSGIVWSERPHTSRKIMAMDDDMFTLALSARLPERYGDIELSGKRGAYPLTLQHAEEYTGHRMALIADAAHGIHPIAGQGLNLGMRDVADLAELIITAHVNGDDIGSAELLDQYTRARRMDNMGMVGATDMLTWLFGSKIPGIGPARRFGLMAVERIPALKKFFIQQAMGSELNTRAYVWDTPVRDRKKSA